MATNMPPVPAVDSIYRLASVIGRPPESVRFTSRSRWALGASKAGTTGP